jgi:catechol 2,3-dioxygenase-like lactoylglutathione lyase family enzyme
MTAHVDVVGLVAADLGRSLAFYRALGCAVPGAGGEHAQGDPPGGGHVDIGLGTMRLMLDTEAVMTSFDPGWQRGPAGRLSLAAQCDSPAAVDELHETLSGLGRGSQLAPFDAPWGQRYASVLDPDGVRVDLYAALGD